MHSESILNSFLCPITLIHLNAYFKKRLSAEINDSKDFRTLLTTPTYKTLRQCRQKRSVGGICATPLRLRESRCRHDLWSYFPLWGFIKHADC